MFGVVHLCGSVKYTDKNPDRKWEQAFKCIGAKPVFPITPFPFFIITSRTTMQILLRFASHYHKDEQHQTWTLLLFSLFKVVNKAFTKLNAYLASYSPIVTHYV
jgi:hypothetical protein